MAKIPMDLFSLVGTKLYGTTANGGDNDLGTVFVINTDGNNYQRLYSFDGEKRMMTTALNQSTT